MSNNPEKSEFIFINTSSTYFKLLDVNISQTNNDEMVMMMIIYHKVFCNSVLFFSTKSSQKPSRNQSSLLRHWCWPPLTRSEIPGDVQYGEAFQCDYASLEMSIGWQYLDPKKERKKDTLEKWCL